MNKQKSTKQSSLFSFFAKGTAAAKTKKPSSQKPSVVRKEPLRVKTNPIQKQPVPVKRKGRDEEEPKPARKEAESNKYSIGTKVRKVSLCWFKSVVAR